MALYVRFRKIGPVEVTSLSIKNDEGYQPVKKVIILSDLKTILLNLEEGNRWVEVDCDSDSIEALKNSKVLSGVNALQEVPLHEGVTNDQ
jgi:hypothetical protein